ncbi:MAG: sigma-70 family RNA polymerase sigma factor [Polyangiaceae bacterium]
MVETVDEERHRESSRDGPRRIQTMDVRSDEELMAAHARGETGCFEELHRRYAGLLYRALCRMTRDEDAARDMTQLAFMHAHRARADFDPSRRFKPWLLTIAYNAVRQEGRARRRRPEEPPRDDVPDQAAPELTVRLDVRRALAALPEHYRQAIELHWFEGLSFDEIAALLGTTATAVKLRAFRGYEQMRATLGPESNHPPPAGIRGKHK